MRNISLILLAAGSSSRFGMLVKKQWLYQGDIPLWYFVAKRFERYYNFDKIVVVGNTQELKLMSKFDNYIFVAGSTKSRQNSLKAALESIDSDFVLVSDVARCCIPKDLVLDLIANAKEGACVVPAIKVSDTTYYDNKPIDREKLLRVQTPQVSDTKILKELIRKDGDFTDESTLFFNYNKDVIFVNGSNNANKLTYKDELNSFRCLKKPISSPKVGFGIDIHPFEDNKDMYLCGVKIDAPYGFKAHSDGDVAIHALIDAMLGASSLGDIGELFPDSDDKYKNIDSKELLKEVVKLVRGVGYEILNCDLSIVAQKPKISPYKNDMEVSLSKLLDIDRRHINIKATTAEKLGFIGREEGVKVYANVVLDYYKWGEE